MSVLVPKGARDEAWKQLAPNRDYAVLCNLDDSVFFKFGQGRGFYIAIDPSSGARLVNEINYESGDLSLIGKLPSDTKVTLGRTSDAGLKVMHAMISRHHIEFTLLKNVLMVRDLGSTNGSYIYAEIPSFDIAEYLEHHPLGSAASDTLNWVHEAFGFGIDDFLKNYSSQKKENN